MAAFSSPPVSRRRCLRYSTPAWALSIAEDGSSGRVARLPCTHDHVPGITCITPRALAGETIPLLNPLSCHAIAAASDGDTPSDAATFWMSEAPRRVGLGSGAACGTTV